LNADITSFEALREFDTQVFPFSGLLTRIWGKRKVAEFALSSFSLRLCVIGAKKSHLDLAVY